VHRWFQDGETTWLDVGQGEFLRPLDRVVHRGEMGC
jgi:hypothetical protein